MFPQSEFAPFSILPSGMNSVFLCLQFGFNSLKLFYPLACFLNKDQIVILWCLFLEHPRSENLQKFTKPENPAPISSPPGLMKLLPSKLPSKNQMQVHVYCAGDHSGQGSSKGFYDKILLASALAL